MRHAINYHASYKVHFIYNLWLRSGACTPNTSAIIQRVHGKRMHANSMVRHDAEPFKLNASRKKRKETSCESGHRGDYLHKSSCKESYIG